MRLFKGVGIGLTLLGAVVSVIESLVEDAKLDAMLDEKLKERGISTKNDEES